jgi:O-antigen/teichoic acid export membrane protein
VTVIVDTKRVLARNTAWNYAGFVLNLATNLALFPFVVRHLGDAASGIWLLLSSITGYMGLLELGIVPSLTQSIAASRARGGRDDVSRVASTAEAVLISLGCVSLLLFPFAGRLVHLLGIPPELQAPAVLAFKITIVGFAMRMPLAMFQGVLLGFQRQDRCNQLWIVLGLAKLAAAAVVLSAGYGLVTLVACEMVLHLLAGVLQITWVYQEEPELRLTWSLINRNDVRHLLSFGGAILGVTISSLVIEQTDRLVIAGFLPVAMVTYYAAAWKIYMLSYTLTTTLVGAVSPVAADLFGRGDTRGLANLFLRSTKYALAVAWPLVLTLAFAGGVLLRFWMGARFVSALPVVQVLLVGFIVTAHNHAGYSALIGMRRVGPTVGRYFAPQAVLNLVLSVWLVHRYGNLGVALGTMVPALLLEFWFLRFVLEELNVAWQRFWRDAAWPVAAAALVSYCPLAVMFLVLDPSSLVLALAASACSALYVALLWRTLDDDERGWVIERIPEPVRRRFTSVNPPVLTVRPDQQI